MKLMYRTRHPIDYKNKGHQVVLHGPDGIGKSEIVLEYAHRVHSIDQSFFWIDATTEETAIDSILKYFQSTVRFCRWEPLRISPACQSILHTVGMQSMPFFYGGGRATALQSFIAWLTFEKEGGDLWSPLWFVVLDNINDFGGPEWHQELLGVLGNSSRGIAIATTNHYDENIHQSSGFRWKPIEISRLKDHEALELLQKTGGLRLEPETHGKSTQSGLPDPWLTYCFQSGKVLGIWSNFLTISPWPSPLPVHIFVSTHHPVPSAII